MSGHAAAWGPELPRATWSRPNPRNFPIFSFFFLLPLSFARSLSLMLTQRFPRALPDVNIFHIISLVGAALPIWGGKNLQVKLADDMQLELIWSKVLSPTPPSLLMHSTRALACMHARFAKRVARRPELQRLSISVLWRCYTLCCTLIPHSTAVQYYYMSSGIQHHIGVKCRERTSMTQREGTSMT